MLLAPKQHPTQNSNSSQQPDACRPKRKPTNKSAAVPNLQKKIWLYVRAVKVTISVVWCDGLLTLSQPLHASGSAEPQQPLASSVSHSQTLPLSSVRYARPCAVFLQDLPQAQGSQSPVIQPNKSKVVYKNDTAQQTRTGGALCSPSARPSSQRRSTYEILRCPRRRRDEKCA